MNKYRKMTARDITRLMNMPAVCDQPCIDVSRVLRDKLPGASALTYITLVYKWGYLQGARGIEDWHGQQIART